MRRSIGGSLQILTYSWACHSIICIGRVVDLGPLQYDFVGILTVLVFYVYTKATVILRREFRGDLKLFFLAATDTGLMISGLV